MNLTGGGAFYSLTPRRILEDLGLNELKANSPYPPAWLLAINGSTGKAHRLDLSPSARNPLYQKGANKGSFCKGAGAKRLRIFNQDILRPSAEILSANLMTNAQNDKIKSPLPPFKKGGKIPAFTLAEVLVTLGLIGIVAAMTLPMLAENYQRRVVETRLKKFYTTFNQAILRSVNDNGPYNGWFYYVSNGNRQTIDNSFNYFLRPYLSVIQSQEIQYTNGAATTMYYLSDGSSFLYSTTHNRDIYYYPKNPVRCLKQPAVNRTGVCEFSFLFVPAHTKKDGDCWRHHVEKGLEPYMYCWDGDPKSFYEEGTYSCHKNGSGHQCTGLIYHNQWEIPKDYPRKLRY
ncbi:type II secretion system protein [bacterium]|nr:type II secretion system protein [bacterium]